MENARYNIDKEGKFTIYNYHNWPSFSSFFPGIAGIMGVPMWIFYVNKAQAICGLGSYSKDSPLIEFLPADKSYQEVFKKGFRTFIKVYQNDKKILYYEPFRVPQNKDIIQKMTISSYDLEIEEINKSLGLKVCVKYFPLPLESFGALVRILSLESLNQNLHLELLDGLPEIIGYGVDNKVLKFMSYTLQAWMQTRILENKACFYRLKVIVKDTPHVIPVNEGNFFLSFYYKDNRLHRLPPIVDPSYIFLRFSDYSYPEGFFNNIDFQLPSFQITEGIKPSAFYFRKIDLTAGKKETIYSLWGYVKKEKYLDNVWRKLEDAGYLYHKYQQNKHIIEELKDNVFMRSNLDYFNLYMRQTFLDNLLRGGYPITLKTKDKSCVFYVFSRKHGDLERDYNNFKILPTYYSQGEGNFRDLAQNRRNDVFFNPLAGEENIIKFYNLIQLDGFNPLLIKPDTFIFSSTQNISSILSELINDGKTIEELKQFLSKPFSIGELCFYIEEKHYILKKSFQEVIETILSYCERIDNASFKEGYWTDHWVYNTDFLEAYKRIYPDKFKELLFEKKVFTFYDSAAFVAPRSEKYIQLDDKIKQLYSVIKDEEKLKLIKNRESFKNVVRTQQGKGEIYKTTLIVKILTLILNKISSLDPFGKGIEMEADKPNWYDALNGLPGLFGSSINETMELKRLIDLIYPYVEENKYLKVRLPVECSLFFRNLYQLLKEYFNMHSEDKEQYWWERSYTFKEEYRASVRFGIRGEEEEISLSQILEFLKLASSKLDIGIKKAFNQQGLFDGYFINEPVEFEYLRTSSGEIKRNRFGFPVVRVLRFQQIPLPLFLEPQVHSLRYCRDKNFAKEIYLNVKKSALYDDHLKMYKVNASLEKMSPEIGRTKIFSPGWLENESIWLHMEYKYILELIKSGLFDEFFEEFRNCLVCFQEPERYGRSILENSSFIVSSAHVNRNLHGRGFVARLSGSTAEMIDIWINMLIGISGPFLLEKGNLVFRLKPVLKSEFFIREPKEVRVFLDGKEEKFILPPNTVCFKLFNKIIITYHNPYLKDTFGEKGVHPVKYILHYPSKTEKIESSEVNLPFSEDIRQGKVIKMDVYLE